jgi:hypothetical protein
MDSAESALGFQEFIFVGLKALFFKGFFFCDF